MLVYKKGTRRFLFGLMLTAGITFAAALGCNARHKQMQHFAVRDPETGAVSYYRMEIWGGSLYPLITQYQMQAGYFSAAAIDLLTGKSPSIPELELSPQHQEIFDATVEQFYAYLLQEAKRKANVTDPEAIMVAAQARKALAERRRDDVQDLVSLFNGKIEALERENEELRKSTEERTAAMAAAREEETAKRTKLKNASDALDAWKALDQAQRRVTAIDVEVSQLTQRKADLSGQITQKTAQRDALPEGDPGRTPLDAEITRLNAEVAEIDRQLTAKNQEKAGINLTKLTDDTTKAEAAEALKDQPAKNLEEAQKRVDDLVKEVNAISARITEDAKAVSDANLKRQANLNDLEQLRTKKLALESKLRVAKSEVTFADERLTRVNEAVGDKVSALPTSIREGESLEPKSLEQIRKDAVHLAYIVWMSTLSPSDVASIGMSGSVDPFRFRKLVLWASAKNIDLRQFATEVDGVVEAVTSLGLSFKQISKQVKEQRAAAAKDRKMRNMSRLQQIGTLNPDLMPFVSLLAPGISLPPATENNPGAAPTVDDTTGENG